jgi:spermidine/putrescine transport system permease protein
MKTKLNLPLIYIWLGLFSLLPLILMLIVSFLSKQDSRLFALPFSLHAYTELLSPLFFKIMSRSIIMATLTCIICLLLAYPFSYILIKSKYQSILLLLIIIPFWTSSLVRTYALISILKFNGILNTILLKLHLIHTPITWLYTNFAVGCGLVYTLFPFMVLPIFSNMEQFDFRLIEAAQDLGAKRLTIFFRVFLPNTMPGIASGCLLVFLPAMTLFYIPNVLGGARSMLLGNLIQDQFLVLENWPQGASISVALTLALLLLLWICRRFESKNL